MATRTDSAKKAVEHFRATFSLIKQEVSKFIVGQEDIIEDVLNAVACGDILEEMVALALALTRAGAGVIGGCCGTIPEHFKAIRQAVDGSSGGRPNIHGRFSERTIHNPATHSW